MNKLKMLEKAKELRERRKYREESEVYRKVLQGSGPDDAVMCALARALFQASMYESNPGGPLGQEALSWIQRAIGLSPGQPEYHWLLGDMVEHIAVDYEQAERAYRRALELEPTFQPALVRLAFIHGVPEVSVTLEEATTLLERAVRVLSTRSAWHLLADVYEKGGRLADRDRAREMAALETKEITYKTTNYSNER